MIKGAGLQIVRFFQPTSPSGDADVVVVVGRRTEEIRLGQGHLVRHVLWRREQCKEFF
jgi:hypothetical protein